MTKERSGIRKKKGTTKKLPAHITHLEMRTPLTRMPPVPTRPTIALIHARNIPVAFYRFLYELVGKAYHWEQRRLMNDQDLFHTINGPNADISVLYADGCPAGFFELDLQNHPAEVELKYLGLGQSYQGKGLGKWFCAAAISAAWSHKPEKLTVETNTLDHSAALPLYQKLGFSPVAVSDAEITPWN